MGYNYIMKTLWVIGRNFGLLSEVGSYWKVWNGGVS